MRKGLAGTDREPVELGLHGVMEVSRSVCLAATILLPAPTVEGLQVLNTNGKWVRMDAPPGSIILNTGDYLQRLSNDRLPSTTHRVVNPPEVAGRHRYSLPFFAHPRPDCDLSVLPRFIAADRPCRHAPITAGGYLAQRLREIGLVS